MILNKPSHLLSERTSLWSMPLEDLLRALETSEAGLSTQEALARLKRVGPNTVAQRAHLSPLLTLLRQFASPFILILIAAAGLSFALHEPTDGTIILSIVFVSSVLSFWQEHAANASVKKLLKTVELKATALRDGNPSSIPAQELVPGDVILLAPGSSIPADCRLLAAQDLFVDEAVLTGESYPVHKTPGIKPPDTPIGQRDNVLFQGTHVVSGTGKAVVVFTGRATEFGRIFLALQMKAPETEFERGVRRFGYLLLEVTLILVLLIFALNVYLQRPVLDSFLFSLALAVGLTPQLLPAIISVNLAKGARDGETEGDREAIGVNRELREYGCAVHRQDRDPDRRTGPRVQGHRPRWQRERTRSLLRLSQRFLSGGLHQPGGPSHPRFPELFFGGLAQVG